MYGSIICLSFFLNKTELDCLLLNILYEYKDKYKVHIDISIGREL